MIVLDSDSLLFSFPEVHASAQLTIDFQRTLRIPDDDKDYPLPPGLGSFPLRHVDDYSHRVPETWMHHGGVMLPMYQSEALWLNFSPAYDEDRRVRYPLAIKIAAGKINAVTGDPWSSGLHRLPHQDYMVAPEQPWLDGYCVEQGIIRQFVAMPLGDGYTAEEQLTGQAEVGGLQLSVCPMKPDVFEKRFPTLPPENVYRQRIQFSMPTGRVAEMGLALGGRMKQDIEKDPFELSDWDVEHTSRCFVHIANSMEWRQITGDDPPQTPVTAKEYERAGLPWFAWYKDQSKPLSGSKHLAGLKSVSALGKEKHQHPLSENQSVKPGRVVDLSDAMWFGQVREFMEP